MPARATEAIVVHAFDYLESSRIIKLLTRDLGLRSALARGARSSRKRFGAALDLFAQGTAELEVRPGRDLDTLGSFEVTRTRGALAMDLARFAGAAAIAEMILRFARDDVDADLFDVTADALDRIAGASGAGARDAAIGGAWRLLAALGFAPSLEDCGECQRTFGAGDTVLFSHSAGGALCEVCASLSRVGRKLPAPARATLAGWIAGEDPGTALSDVEARAHQRLLREFIVEHLTDGKPMRAFEAWETGSWSAA